MARSVVLRLIRMLTMAATTARSTSTTTITIMVPADIVSSGTSAPPQSTARGVGPQTGHGGGLPAESGTVPAYDHGRRREVMSGMAMVPERPEVQGSPGTPGARPTARSSVVWSVALLAGGAALGLLGGLIWGEVAPRVLLQEVSAGSAEIVNTETRAF